MNCYFSNEIRLATLISERKWTIVQNVLLTSNEHHECYQCTDCFANHSLLHLSCTLNPPISIVKQLIKAYPRDVFERDCRDRFPLHVAVENSASNGIIDLLLNQNPKAAISKDSRGRTPLHLVFEDYRRKQNKIDRHFYNFIYFTVESLCRAAPTSVLVHVNGVSIIENALELGAEFNVVRKLQRTTQYVRESRLQIEDEHSVGNWTTVK